MDLRRWASGAATLALIGGVTALASGPAHRAASPPAAVGPYGTVVDLGPSHSSAVAVDVALSSTQLPAAVTEWAARHGLHVRWEPGQDWAGLWGSADRMARALDVPIHDFRTGDGVRFYAGTRAIALPPALRGAVAQVGHILSYRPAVTREVPREIPGPGPHLDVPPDGLAPAQGLAAYQATPLARAGFTGKGDTVVIFEITPPSQRDLDAFSAKVGLPKFSPVLDGSFPGKGRNEADLLESDMDFEVVHALVPDARLIAADISPAYQGHDAHTAGEAMASWLTSLTNRYPNSVWSTSYGFVCNRMINQADLAPIQSALAAAHARGITAFDAAGDTDGLECKYYAQGGFAAPPSQNDVGVDALASLPGMTSVGGTRLDVDASGNWVAEATWMDSPAQQGTGGGIDTNWPRPDWQRAQGIENVGDATHRLVPDVSADADPDTGFMALIEGRAAPGGGTSQAAPIWAAITVMINEYLRANGGHDVGDINPLLYRIARGAARPAFHDITLGANAVFRAGPGYDPVTGLGSPDAANLAADLLDLQRSGS